MLHAPPKSTMPVLPDTRPALLPGERFVLEGQGGFLFPIRGWRVARFFLTNRRIILYVRPRILVQVRLSRIIGLREKKLHFVLKYRDALGIVYRPDPGEGGGKFWICTNDVAAWKKAINSKILENLGQGAQAPCLAPV